MRLERRTSCAAGSRNSLAQAKLRRLGQRAGMAPEDAPQLGRERLAVRPYLGKVAMNRSKTDHAAAYACAFAGGEPPSGMYRFPTVA